MNDKVKRLAQLSLLTAVALIIFVVELQIPNPFPIPGIKLGLANIVTVYAVYHYRWYEVSAVVVLRVVLGSLFSGNMMALIYSLSGSFFCLVGMLLLRKIVDEKHIPIASVFGAILHNTGQMAAALLITQTPQLLAYYPFLIVSGCLAGLFTGLLAQFIIQRLNKIKKKTG
ncbi:MAG: Gx transporter family protein [Ruminococcus sp.]|nr:Gx transporter family protein [Ruminococcus sp.]